MALRAYGVTHTYRVTVRVRAVDEEQAPDRARDIMDGWTAERFPEELTEDDMDVEAVE